MSETKSVDFIRQIIVSDNESGKHEGRVHTRFPPEPNGYLHIGHAKSICLNYGIAAEFGGQFNLRFDDTNPEKEEVEYVESIKEDVAWLGAKWGDNLFFASDYFEKLYECAVQLIKQGDAYVCSLTAEETKEYRGGWNSDGRDSPDRDRSVDENLDLFDRMKNGEFPDGKYTLRAKIDMSSPNMNLRDPAMYRIRHAHHHRTGDQWCVYPTYDWTHGQSDSFEGVTHSLCTLEFENHRPLYDWYIEKLGVFHPQQIEFAKLRLTHTVMSKRKLRELVEHKHVDGWDDPRMPTISAFRRRGYTPESIRNFCHRIGITKFNSLTDFGLLEQSIREHLNQIAPRRMAVLRPLKVIIENYPESAMEVRHAINNPEDDSA
ncbi:MAG: glutamine--tRNA ligase, partial [Pirellulaceae bacterium]